VATRKSIGERLTALEREVANLKATLAAAGHDTRPWWEQIWGHFANDEAFEEAMRLGRKYRESLDRKPRRKAARKARKAPRRP
jgi:hypothetical protein